MRRSKQQVRVQRWMVPTLIKLDVDHDDPGAWRARWEPRELAPVGRRELPDVVERQASTLLDEFVGLGRPTNDRTVRSRLKQFVKRWGTWAWCERGDIHPPFAVGMVAGEGHDWSRVPVVDDRGVPIVGLDGMRVVDTADDKVLIVPRRYLLVGEDDRDPVGLMVQSARRVNALRGIHASLQKGRVARSAEWLSVWPAHDADAVSSAGWPAARHPIGDQVQQTEVMVGIVDHWLAALHVRPSFGPNGLTFKVGSASGALAVAFATELWAKAWIQVCIECGTTWRHRRGSPDIDRLCRSCKTRRNSSRFRQEHPDYYRRMRATARGNGTNR